MGSTTVLDALRTLERCGVSSVEDVSAMIALEEASSSLSSLNAKSRVVADLDAFLSEQEEDDVHRSVCEWVASQGWFWNCVKAYPEIASLFSDSVSSEETETCTSTEVPVEACDVFATASILKAELASLDVASVGVSVEIADSCTTSFNSFIEDARSQTPDVSCKYVSYPVASKADAVVGVKNTRILMQTGFSLSTEGKEVELLVNLIGEGSEGVFSNYQIVTSQGEMNGLVAPGALFAVTNSAQVVRCYDFASAIHQFKIAMLTVAEHLIETVMPVEFVREVEVVVEEEEEEEEMDCAILTPVSVPSERDYVSACSTTELFLDTQESHDSCSPLTPLSSPAMCML